MNLLPTINQRVSKALKKGVFVVEMLADGKPDKDNKHSFFVFWVDETGLKPNGFSAQIFRTNIDKFIKDIETNRPDMKVEICK